MKMKLKWNKQIQLYDGTAEKLVYNIDLEKVPEKAGIYIFGRMHGNKFEALYIGKAENLRKRVKQQLRVVPLMMHIKEAQNGRRVIHTASFSAGRGQRTKSCLPIMERALIRHFLEKGDDIVNVQGTRLPTHEIVSDSPIKEIPNHLILDA